MVERSDRFGQGVQLFIKKKYKKIELSILDSVNYVGINKGGYLIPLF
jgi:hypothetical protein